MKTRYFVSDSYKLDDNVVGRELYLKHGAYYFKDGIVSNCVTFCVENQKYEIHITKVEEMELSDFIADGRTKYELNGIRFVVISKESVSDDCITVRTDSPCTYKDLCADEIAVTSIDKLNLSIFEIASRTHKDASSFHSHIEDIKLVTTCGQCGKDEVQDNGLCSDCISKLPKIESSKVVDIHKSENGSFSVGSVVNMCEHDEIAYTSGQYVEAIEKEVPDAVNHPSHYTGAGIECIEAIKASMTPDALAGYLKGNVQKYLWRYEKKVNPAEDLKKARWYLDYLIKEMEQTNV